MVKEPKKVENPTLVLDGIINGFQEIPLITINDVIGDNSSGNKGTNVRNGVDAVLVSDRVDPPVRNLNRRSKLPKD